MIVLKVNLLRLNQPTFRDKLPLVYFHHLLLSILMLIYFKKRGVVYPQIIHYVLALSIWDIYH